MLSTIYSTILASMPHRQNISVDSLPVVKAHQLMRHIRYFGARRDNRCRVLVVSATAGTTLSCVALRHAIDRGLDRKGNKALHMTSVVLYAKL